MVSLSIQSVEVKGREIYGDRVNTTQNHKNMVK